MAEARLMEGSLIEGSPAAQRRGLVATVSPGMQRSLTAADFQGGWDVHRVIVDHLSGAVHRFTGEVIISAADFVETGEVRHGGVCLKAERRYLLRDGGDGITNGMAAGVLIAFPDGRPFIDLDRHASQAVHHLCGTDDYRGRFFFRTVDAWVESWRVTGPRKRYASLTRYRRQIA